MKGFRRGVVLAVAGVGLPTILFSASPQKAGSENKAPHEAAPGSGEVPAPAGSVVTEEMRSANEAASSSADAAIASLKAARAAIAAEKSKEAAGVRGTPATQPEPPNPPAPSGPSTKKGRAVEKLDSPPAVSGSREVPASPPAAPVPPAFEAQQTSAPPPEPRIQGQAKASVESPKSAPNASQVSTGPVTAPASSTAPVAAPPSDKPAPSPAAQSHAAPAAQPAAEAAKAPSQSQSLNASEAQTPSVEAAAAAAAAALATPGSEPAAGEVKKKSRFGSEDALGDAAKKKGKGKSKETVKLTPEQQKAAEIKAFCDKARDAIKRGEEDVARGLLESLVAVDLPHVEKKIALTEVAAVYEEKGDLTKAVAILEKLATVLEGDTEVPVWLLKLGMLYREAGAYQMAISRYYAVIQLAMKVGSSDFERFQAISRQAQREIANTYFIKGDFDQAQKFYNMALRSDLPKEERAVAMFRAAHCTFMRNDMNGAINALERFLKDFSRHASAAEARYMLATAYKVEGRPQDAYDSVIDLLRDAKGKSEEDPKAWAYWQKKAGNEFANDYYQRGEFVNSVTIYQALAAIEESPEWRWPVVYQMGLCFERLRIEPRAAECYKYIVDESKRPEFRWRKMPQSVANLVEMAGWRVEQLAWDSNLNSKLRAVAGAETGRSTSRGVRR
jgi:tetratricopeptide (TPR) repeat protein